MPTVKCPSCAAALKLKQAPAGGKIKCPKCGNVIALSAPSAAGGGASAPDDDGFDFGKIDAPSAGQAAVSQFPVGEKLSVYQGPIPGDPNEMELIEEDTGPTETVPPPVKAPEIRAAGADDEQELSNKKSPVVLILAIVGVLAVVGGGGAAAFMFLGGGGDSGSSSEEDDLPQVIIAE